MVVKPVVIDHAESAEGPERGLLIVTLRFDCRW